MPVSFWKASAIFWPCSIGVEVYQDHLALGLRLGGVDGLLRIGGDQKAGEDERSRRERRCQLEHVV
jgi:hypothetical protein